MDKIGPIVRSELKSRFLLFSALIGMFLLPIIQANVLFADDHSRAIRGWISLGISGRTGAELLFTLLHLNSNISDVGTFFQILSVCILALPIALFSLFLKYNRLSALLTLPFIACTPFFLHNLSYRYDALNMSFSVAAGVLAVCAQMRGKYFLSFLCVLGIFNFYQASFSVFLILSCLVSLWFLVEEGLKPSLKYSFVSGIIGVLGLVIYKIQIVLFNFLPIKSLHIRDYGADHAKISLHISHILHNLSTFLNYGFYGFNNNSVKGIFFALSFGLVMAVLAFLFKLLTVANQQMSWKDKALFLAYGLGIFIIAIASIAGPMALLESPIIVPRTLVGMGAFYSLCFAFLSGRQLRWRGIGIFSSCLTGFALFEVLLGAFIYGVALKAEDEFDTHLVDQMISDTYQLAGHQQVTVRYMNVENIPYAPKTLKARQLQPWLSDILGNYHYMFFYFNTSEFWFERNALESMKGQRTDERDIEAEKIISTCDFDHSISRPYYNLYRKDDKIIIDFKSKCAVPLNKRQNV